LIPTLDELTGDDVRERDEETPYANAYEWILLAWVPVELCVLAAAFWSIGHVEWSTFETVGLVLSMGTSVGGGGITVAHELMHRRDKRSRAAAEFLMTCASYPHFCVEHILGHHKNIGTHEDPATARYGESLYMFWPRTLIGTLRSAWELETTRVQRRKISPWSLKNRRLRHPLNVVAFYSVAWLLGGLPAVGFAIAQSVVAILLLETVNYLEHYGLERAQTSEGTYERVAPHHSWNSNHRVTGWQMFYLNRHSDHHARADRPYPNLRAYSDAPNLPGGYPTMMLVAFIPPLWFAWMNPRVEAVRAKAAA